MHKNKQTVDVAKKKESTLDSLFYLARACASGKSSDLAQNPELPSTPLPHDPFLHRTIHPRFIAQSASMWFRVRAACSSTPPPNFSWLPLRDFPEFRKRKRGRKEEAASCRRSARTYSREAGSARCCDVGCDPGAAVLLPTV